jgi:hypothetical protein
MKVAGGSYRICKLTLGLEHVCSSWQNSRCGGRQSRPIGRDAIELDVTSVITF